MVSIHGDSKDKKVSHHTKWNWKIKEGLTINRNGSSSNGGERNLSPLWEKRGTKSWLIVRWRWIRWRPHLDHVHEQQKKKKIDPTEIVDSSKKSTSSDKGGLSIGSGKPETRLFGPKNPVSNRTKFWALGMLEQKIYIYLLNYQARAWTEVVQAWNLIGLKNSFWVGVYLSGFQTCKGLWRCFVGY